jgi:hypothetical protein
VFLLLFLLIHRTLLHARRSGQPFSFYLCAGIALATGVQFLLIAGGSLGLVPLTGISVPFLSYGNVSLIINLTAMGVVFAVANRPGVALQHDYLEKHYDPVLATGIAGFLIGSLVLAGRDLLACAQTGSGKTAAFLLPLVAQLSATTAPHGGLRALVLVPTRERAAQSPEVATALAQDLPVRLKVLGAWGGVSINPQLMALRGGADLLIATPGRLLDLIDHNGLTLSALATLVLDEADRLFALGQMGRPGAV